MEEKEKENARVFILLTGATIFFTILCCGCRQLALLEQRIEQLHDYHRLQQELVELSADFNSSEDEYEDENID